MGYFNQDFIKKIQGYRYVVYLRKSQDGEDRQIASLPRQKRECKEEIVDKYELNKVIKPFLSESRTAFKLGRPEFRKMTELIESDQVDGVITWHSNRLARNYGDGGYFTQLMMDGKLKIVLTTAGFYENTPKDLEYLMTEFTRAARDSGDKSDAVKSGNRTRFFDQKRWIGFAKPGYINAEDPISKE